jgi:hypothetical protein
MPGKFLDRPKQLEHLLASCAGEIRNLIAFLLWINQPHLVETTYVPAARGFHKAKPIAYAAHHVVKLAKGFTRQQAKAHFKARHPPRRHEVRAFWRNRGMTTGCDHKFPLFPNEEEHFICSKCGGKRFRVHAHMRGDAGRGFVTKDYVA